MRAHAPVAALLTIAAATAVTVLTLSLVGSRTVLRPTVSSPLAATEDGTVTGLEPGGPAKDVNYTITNLRGKPRYVSTVTISMSNFTYFAAAGSGVGVTGLNHPAGGPAISCTAADFTIVAPDVLDEDLVAGRTAFTRLTSKKSGTIAMNTVSKTDDCEGASGALTLAVG